MARAIARSTPNFAPPATQNTAPVHEFKCLYTHDLRKKSKKWHDGSARFHTFNKRVMVYDDAKNYIGDLHYRADEEFGEGVELRLDRGVLVEVGERVGETQTDLTGIINRHHADYDGNSSSIATPTQSRPVQRIHATNPQARPKSLIELLGASQRRLGRAMLPVQSPFEQRQNLAIPEHEEHPSKRQRMAVGKENDHPDGPAPRLLQTTAKPSPEQRGVPASTRHTARVQAWIASSPTIPPSNEGEGIVSISSDEEVSVPRKRPANNPQTTERSSSTTDVRQRPSRRNEPDTARSTTPDRAQKTAAEPTLSTAPVSVTADTSIGSSLKPGMSSLKMNHQKPRRKLMYRALLPSSTTESCCETVQARTQRPARLKATSAGLPACQVPRSDDNAAEEDDPFTFDELEDLDSPAVPYPPEETQRTPMRAMQALEPDDSPLFVSQSLSQRSPPTSHSHVHEDFGIPATQVLAGQSDLRSADCHNTDQDAEMDEEHDSEPDCPMFPLPPSRLKLAIQGRMNPSSPSMLESASAADDTVLSIPPLPGSAPNKKSPAARSLSQHDSPLPRDPRALPLHPSVFKQQPLLQIIGKLPQHPTSILPPPDNTFRKPSPKKSPIQRSKSDTAAIVPDTTTGSESPLIGIEQGPWTSLEAFLLFDKWPQCKQKDKPVFERTADYEDEDGEEGGDTVVNAKATGFAPASKLLQPAGITSARRVLRDEY